MPSPEISRRRAIQVLGLGTATLLSDGIPLLREASISKSGSGPRKELEPLEKTAVFGRVATFTEFQSEVRVHRLPNSNYNDVAVNIGDTYGSAHLHGTINFSPDGRRLAVSNLSTSGMRVRSVFSGAVVVGVEDKQYIPLSQYLDHKNPVPTLFAWSPDSEKLAVFNGQHAIGKTTLVNMETNQAIASRDGPLPGSFSPDNRWFLRPYRQSLELIGMDKQYQKINNAGPAFAWSPDNRSVLYQSCSKWGQDTWGPYCQAGSLALYDIEAQTSRILTPADPSHLQELLFSADGQKFLFSKTTGLTLPETNPAIFDLVNDRVITVDLSPLQFGKAATRWRRLFHGPETLLFAGGKGAPDRGAWLVWIDANTGRITKDQYFPSGGEEWVGVKKVFSQDILFEVSQPDRSTQFYLAPMGDPRRANWQLVGSLPKISSEGDSMFAAIRDGEQFEARGSSWFFFNNQRSRLEHPEIGSYLGAESSRLPEVFADSIPEGEAIRFTPGDVVVRADGKGLHLRNNQGVLVDNLPLFRRKTRLEQSGRHIWPSEPAWIINRIQTATHPHKGKDKLMDWDNREKETQVSGGRMILFISGYSSDSAGHLQTFAALKERLRQNGWNDAQFLEGTYNVEARVIGPGEVQITPRVYTSEHTKVHPMDSVNKLMWHMRRYLREFPNTRFIIIGHSLGGFLGFHIASIFPYSTETLITFDSPLEVIPAGFLGGIRDGAIRIMGDPVMRFFTDLSNFQGVRDKAAQIKSKGVKLLTLTNRDDKLTPDESAVLEESDHEIQLVWELGHTQARLPRSIEELVTELITGHGQILDDRGVLEALAPILPSS